MSKTIRVKVDIDDRALQDKLTFLLDNKTMLEIHNLFAKKMDPYVPFLEGPLSQTVEITPQYVRYIQPYAHYQYVGEGFNFTRDYHPLASAYWDKAMLNSKGEEFVEEVRQILVRRAKEIYG
jgi:hypothetical protein